MDERKVNMETMLWIVAVFVACALMFGFVNLLVWIWDKLDPPAKITEVRVDGNHKNAA